jgi:hypothetical protein
MGSSAKTTGQMPQFFIIADKEKLQLGKSANFLG